MTLAGALTAIVRGDAVPPETWAAIDVEAFCQAAHHHGLLPLVAERIRLGGRQASATPLTERVLTLAREHAALNLAAEVELRAALGALDDAGLRPVVFKGAHLAYADYARPDLRPRLDTDVMIPADAASRALAHDVLTALGYTSPPHLGGDLVMTQRAYVRRRHAQVVHAIDVHWRIANPQVFARVLAHDELWRDAVPLPRLSPGARGPSGPHALFIACVHRIAHHADSDCLMWLLDIDRIARRLSPPEWGAFVRLAADRRVIAVCGASLARAAAAFATPIPDDVRRQLPSDSSRAHEPSASVLGRSAVGMRAAIRDWQAVPSLAGRLRLLREHLTPSADYMRNVYAPGSHAPLAWLYVKRVAVGARKRRRRALPDDR